MAYLGHSPATGENNAFKILDDITSYTLTFNGSLASDVSVADNTIYDHDHRFITGQRVTYNAGGGTPITGLANGVYYIIRYDQNRIQLASSVADANSGTEVPFTGLGVGTSHTLNVAFDGVNTRFKATFNNGTKAGVTRAAQLSISINGVIQQPNDTTTPVNGFGLDINDDIIFSVAPESTDVFWGNLLASNFATFDITDNTVDTFTGDNSTVSFTLSKIPKDERNILVTLDGVVQYPTEGVVTRAYTVSENVITFTSAPGLGVEIQVRHIGFAGRSLAGVGGTSQYGPIGIQSSGTTIKADAAVLNFIGVGNTFAVNGNTVDIAINVAAGGTWTTYDAGIATSKSVGVNTTTLDDTDLVGIGNSFNGLYISNGMIVVDNSLNGNHYIGTNFNGLMAGPVNITGVLTVDGHYVVV